MEWSNDEPTFEFYFFDFMRYHRMYKSWEDKILRENKKRHTKKMNISKRKKRGFLAISNIRGNIESSKQLQG
jgi:hypothetical protein